MMKLSLNIPHRYYKDFCDFSDIQIVDLDILKQYPDTYDNVPKDMEVWLNRGTPALLDEFLKRFRSTDRVLKVCSFTMTTVADSFKEGVSSFRESLEVALWEKRRFSARKRSKT